jgi:hypothetical protein
VEYREDGELIWSGRKKLAWRWEAAGRCGRWHLEVGAGRQGGRRSMPGGGRRSGGAHTWRWVSGEVGEKAGGLGFSGSARAWERKK